MSFGDVIRSALAPSLRPYGIGGDADTIWHVDIYSDLVYELSTTDFSVVRSDDSPSSGSILFGIGGDASAIWTCYAPQKIAELSTTDFSIERQATAPYLYPSGIGGDANTIWHCEQLIYRVYELSTTDFSVVRYASSPDSGPEGIGGDANTIWYCDAEPDDVYKLSTSDFSVLQQAAAPGGIVTGIGGDADTIWHCRYNPSGADRVYELDAAVSGTPATIGILWVKGTELHQGDGQGDERYFQGEDTGLTDTPYKIKVKGNYLYYASHSSGTVKRLLFTDTGVDSTPMKICYVIAGTKLRDYDYSGNQREKTGTLA